MGRWSGTQFVPYSVGAVDAEMSQPWCWQGMQICGCIHTFGDEVSEFPEPSRITVMHPYSRVSHKSELIQLAVALAPEHPGHVSFSIQVESQASSV